ncbi:MAG: sensor histidine kinase, partial [Gaiellaceae bacterium]
GTYTDGSWIDAGWLLAYIAIGAAGLHPALGAELVAVQSRRPHGVRWRRFATVAGVALLIPAVCLYALISHRSPLNDVLVGFSVAITVLAFARMAVLLHEQNTQELELRRGESERARLLERTLEVAEEERTAVARDLHDGPIQALTAIALKLDLLAGRAARANSDHAGLAAEIREDVAGEIASLRRLMAGLRPPVLDEKGLAAALADCATVVFEGSGIGCTVRSDLNGAKLAHEFETAVYRIAREALLNARKHSSAHNVEVVLERNGAALRLAIEDDGVGFDVRRHASNGHAGLLGVRELVASMGGSWSLEAAPGFGTRIAATLPWKDARAA